MKKQILILILMVATLPVLAQQKPHYTQYILNPYLINPALSGIENYADIKASHRHQWAGVNDAPVTTYLTAHMPLNKVDGRVSPTGFGEDQEVDYYTSNASRSHHGIGVQMMQDRTGPLTQSTLYATYAYHLGVSDRSTLAAGFGAGLSRYALDGEKLRLSQPGDPSVYQNGLVNKWKPDLNAGVYLYSSHYFVGLSAQQIIPQRLEFRDNHLSQREGRMVPHLFATGGYKFWVGDDFTFTPSLMIKYINPLPVQPEFNAKLQYQDNFWAGASYRHNDGFAAMLGANVSSKFTFGYSYDFTSSQLNTYARGTHELLLGFMLDR